MEYSIVIPVYNSSQTLDELSERLITTCNMLSEDWEVIFIDDNSSDASWEKLLELKHNSNADIKLVRLAKNYGQHSAIFCGLKYTSGDHVVTIDDDLQNAPEDIPLLIDQMNETHCDVVYGIGHKEHSRVRKAASTIWKMGTKRFEDGLGEGSSFRLFTKALKDKLLNHQQSIIFLDELLFWYTGNIRFVEVRHFPRAVGKSGYSPLKLFKLMTKLSFNYGTYPLKMMSLLGGLIAFFSFLLGLFFIVRKLFFNVSVPGFTALIVTILFSTSILLLGLGIIGKYLSNIFNLLNNRPSYSVRDTKL